VQTQNCEYFGNTRDLAVKPPLSTRFASMGSCHYYFVSKASINAYTGGLVAAKALKKASQAKLTTHTWAEQGGQGCWNQHEGDVDCSGDCGCHSNDDEVCAFTRWVSCCTCFEKI
jgi:hypothetical protein